ncbi:MAG: hypothetical protein QXO93_01780 [Acidilobaceae archaeon]
MSSTKNDVRSKEKILKLIDVIPTASSLMKERKILREKRIRLKYDESIEKGYVKINSRLAEILNIRDKVEIVVAGRAKLVFKAIIEDSVEEDRVHVNPDEMVENGISDNSIATIRTIFEKSEVKRIE